MTKLTDERLLGEKALINVSRVLNLVGAVGEAIHHDFGEDLFVQTHLDGEVDPFSFLIQVKGTSAALKGGYLRARFSIDHLRRWVSNANPVLVCIYSVPARKIYAFAPKDYFTMWELWTTSRTSLGVRLGTESVFNQLTARRWIWDLRLGYFAKHLRDIQYLLGANERHKGGHRQRTKLLRELRIVTFAFLQAVGLIFPDRLSPSFLRSFKNCAISFARSNETDGGDDLQADDAVTLCLLGAIDRKCGTGLDETLMVLGSEVLEQFLKTFHPRDWERALKLLPTQRT